MSDDELPYECEACGARYYGDGAAELCCYPTVDSPGTFAREL